VIERDSSAGAGSRATSPARADMFDEGLAIVEAAARLGLTLRLAGGMAIRLHCRETAFCERAHPDLDLVARRREQEQVFGLLESLGFAESIGIRLGSAGRQTEFTRPCRHGATETGQPVHPEDHIDVYIDGFELDHRIDLRRRLHLHDYTITVSDLLLVKLQMGRAEGKDLTDIITLLKDRPLVEAANSGAEDADAVDPAHIAGVCAGDWGTFHDVSMNLERTRQSVAEAGLDEQERERVTAALYRLETALAIAHKGLAWRLRARIGERLRWRNRVEDQDDPSHGMRAA